MKKNRISETFPMYVEKATKRDEISLFQLALVKKGNYLKILRPF